MKNNKIGKSVGIKQKEKKQHHENAVHYCFSEIKNDKIDLLFLFTASLCFLSFGIYHLGKFFTTDEIVWLYKRYPMYWNSFVNGDWGQFEKFGAQSGILQILLSGWVFFTKNLAAYDYSNVESYLFQWRLPLIIFNCLMLFVIFDRASRLWGRRIAATSVVFISFFPYLVGISQIFNKDTTLWSTAIISILNFYLYLKTKQYRFAIYSGIFLGLALLSKFPASVLYPVYFAFIYLEYLFNDAARSSFIHSLKAYVLCTGISMYVVFIALPPSWFDIRWLFEWTWYSKILEDYVNFIFLSIVILSFEIIVLKGIVSEKVNSYGFLRGWVLIILFGTFFVCLLFMTIVQICEIEDFFEFLNRTAGTGVLIHKFPRAFFAGFGNIVKGSPLIHCIGIFGFIFLIIKNTMSYDRYRFFLYSMVLIMVYYLGAALAGAELSLRYQIILIPIFCIFASYFFVVVLKRRFYCYLTLFAVLLTAEMVHVAPFYISYVNPTDYSFFKNPGVHWGQGGYEIAQSANQLESAEKMKILSDYEGFSPFFRGVGSRYVYRRMLTETNIRQYDYLCLSSIGYRQISSHKAMTPALKKYYELPPEDSIRYIGNEKNYVKLVHVDLKIKENYESIH